MHEEYKRVAEQLREAVLKELPRDYQEFHLLRSKIFSSSQFSQLYHDAVEKRSLYEATRAISNEAYKKDKKHDGDGWRDTGIMAGGDYEKSQHELPYIIINNRWIREINMTPGEYKQMVVEYEQKWKDGIERGYINFDALVELAQLCQYALWQNPLKTTESGLYQPRKRMQIIMHPRQTITHPRVAITHPRKTIMHPQRTYADVLNEVASQLTNLPVFTARVKITSDNGIKEHIIRTLDPKQDTDRPLFKQALEDRIASIKTQNIQNGYLRKRAEVEAEISQRQEQCSEPPTNEPPISRHPSR